MIDLSAVLVGIPCRFSEYNNGEFWRFWFWKLDSFRITDHANVHCEKEQIGCRSKEEIILSIESFGSTMTYIKKKLLSSIISGFFIHEIWLTESNDYCLEVIRGQGRSLQYSIWLSKDWTQIRAIEDNTSTSGNIVFEAMGRFFHYSALREDVLTLHGVLMEYQGYGVIISAPSGTGKTTHARLWRDYRNALIINGDKASLRKCGDTWTGYGLPWSGTSGEQINRSVPIKAVVVLERDLENSAEVLDSMESFAAVLPHIQYPEWDSDLGEKAVDLMLELIGDVPVIRLRCLPDVGAVETLEQVLKSL